VDVLVLARSRYHGVLVGVAAAIKLTPLMFIPMLWLVGRRRAAVTAAGAFAAATALAWLVLPGDSARFWGTEVWRVNRVGHIATGGNQSINGMMLRLGVADHPRSALMLALAVVVAGLALWRAARVGRTDALAATIIVGSASVAISPVSWTHHQVWLVLAALLPVRGPRWIRYGWPALVLALMILPVTSLGSRLPGALGTVLGESRLLLAVAIAVAVPLAARARRGEPDHPDPTGPVGTRVHPLSF
jgi:alpha-1,2-mannosyltransferase